MLQHKMKYLLCRPRGGVNDALNQIEKCWRYAEIHNRFLIVDTEYLVSTGIAVPFSKLFKTKNHNEKVTFNITATLLEHLNQVSTFPDCLTGRLNHYKTKFLECFFDLVDSDTNIKLSFDFNKNYEEDLLVHDQFGGGNIGINCLARLKLTDKFRSDVLAILSLLIGKKHIAISVRHSDLQTDYKRAFEEVYKKSVNQRLLICTDSIEVVRFANSFFDQSEVLTLSLPPHTGEVSLPTYATFHCNDEQRYGLMVKAFSDLIGLATAQETIVCRLAPGKFSNAASQYNDFFQLSEFIKNNQKTPLGINGFSGFAVLADTLRNNPSIINQLLSP